MLGEIGLVGEGSVAQRATRLVGRMNRPDVLAAVAHFRGFVDALFMRTAPHATRKNGQLVLPLEARAEHLHRRDVPTTMEVAHLGAQLHHIIQLHPLEGLSSTHHIFRTPHRLVLDFSARARHVDAGDVVDVELWASVGGGLSLKHGRANCARRRRRKRTEVAILPQQFLVDVEIGHMERAGRSLAARTLVDDLPAFKLRLLDQLLVEPPHQALVARRMRVTARLCALGATCARHDRVLADVAVGLLTNFKVLHVHIILRRRNGGLGEVGRRNGHRIRIQREKLLLDRLLRLMRGELDFEVLSRAHMKSDGPASNTRQPTHAAHGTLATTQNRQWRYG